MFFPPVWSMDDSRGGDATLKEKLHRSQGGGGRETAISRSPAGLPLICYHLVCPGGWPTGTRRKKSFVAYILEMLTECNIVSLTTVSQTLNCVNKVIIWTLAVIWLQQSFAEPLKGLVTIPRIILWEVTSGHVRHHLFTQISELIIEPLMSKLILVSCVVLLE